MSGILSLQVPRGLTAGMTSARQGSGCWRPAGIGRGEVWCGMVWCSAVRERWGQMPAAAQWQGHEGDEGMSRRQPTQRAGVLVEAGGEGSSRTQNAGRRTQRARRRAQGAGNELGLACS